MALTDTQICNDALTLCGANTIMSLTDASREARICNKNYARSRDFVLRQHSWNCAIKRVVLAPNTTTPAFDFTYSFDLPGECLKVVRVGTDPEWRDCDWRVEGRTILFDESTLNLRYVHRITDESLFDENLAETIAHYLAYRIVFALTANNALKTSLFQMYKDTLRISKSMDAKEDSAEQMHSDLFVTSRRSFGASKLRQDQVW